MIYQVTASFLFTEEDAANDFFHDCQVALPTTTVINPHQPNQEISSAQLLISNHELDPRLPSTLLEEIHNEPPPP